ncbi:MAG TPA: cytochrome c-type biogenesis protein [Anaerolineales bacterium]
MNSRYILRLALCLPLFLAFLLFTRPALAQAPTPSDDEVNRIAHELYCPVCENTPLDVCPTEACRQWRDLIRQQLAQGWSESRIKQYFVDQYGARVLAEPPAKGLNWLVYVLPPLIILAGAVLLLRAMRAWTKPGAAGATESGPGNEAPKDDYISRLEEELKKRS